ncbi:pitrilysin family protein [Desulfurobacterium sp. TC5-1]|uniref:M16 family metallopeptidase n=1 Tax=Desulfurobacterium sp. TC5-1 TaxID=1158318 RepID=UPI0003B76D2C|nr:pitrilysin family protein [Desulfurobacterium sp. TC5-1]
MERFKISENVEAVLNPVDELDITSVVIFSENGSVTDNGKAGLTNLSLHVGLKRSVSKTTKEIAFLTEPYGSSIIPETGKDFSTISFQITPDGFPVFIEVLSELITEPAFTEEDFIIEKETTIAAIRARLESAFSFGYEEFNLFTYKNTPYKNLPSGTVETVVPITLNDLKEKYRRFFNEGKFIISIAGKIPENVEKLLSKLPIKGGKNRKLLFKTPIEKSESVNLCRKGSTQTFIIRGYEAPSVNDWKKYVSYKLLNTVVGDGFNSILFQQLREKQGLAYSTGSFFPTLKNPGRFVIYIGTSPEKEEQALKGIDNLIENLPALIGEEDINRAKNYLKGTYLLDHEKRLRKAWYYGWWTVLTGTPEKDTQYIEEIESLTLKDVKEAAEELSKKPYHQVIVCNG